MTGLIIDIDSIEISSWVSRYLWPFFRVAGFFMALPLFGTRLVSVRVRLLLAIAVTMVVVPILPPLPRTDGISLETIIISLQQLIIGVAFGFVVELLMQVFIMSGQLVAMQTGLGMAQMVDPSNGVNVAVVAQWFVLFVNLLFIGLNGHLVAIEILVDSFYSIPVAFVGLNQNTIYTIVELAHWMFTAAIVLALPAITAMLVVNIAFGIMARLSPQLNIFAVGFPITMMLGLIILWLTFGGYGNQFQSLLTELFQTMREFK